MLSSFQEKAPGSLTSSAPAKSAGSQIPKKAPSGSVKMASRPYEATAIGSAIIVPPFSWIARAIASASSTET